MTTQQDERAGQVPLYEQLAAVPKDVRLVIDDGPHSTQYIPVGRMCHEAAALMQADGEVGGEPIGEMVQKLSGNGGIEVKWYGPWPAIGTKLYTRPQQAARVPLTDEDIEELWKQLREVPGLNDITADGWLMKKQKAFARAIEAKFCEINGITTQTPPPGHIVCLTCDGKGYQPMVDDPEKYFQESKP